MKITTRDIVAAINQDAADAEALAHMVDELAAYMMALADVVAETSGPGPSLAKGARSRIAGAVALLHAQGYETFATGYAQQLRGKTA